MKAIRVLVVDDHPLFRKGVAGLLQREGFDVVGDAADGRSAVAQAARLQPDVVLMDIYMPGADGLEATRRIKAALPAMKIVILTVSDEDQSLFEAIKAGANGYLLKSVEPAELYRTLRGVARGEAFLSPAMAARVLDEFARLGRPTAEATSATALSAREREVLELLARGVTNKEIAAALAITENTVKNHMKRIMEKLHLENRVQVVAYAVQEGLVRKPEPS